METARKDVKSQATLTEIKTHTSESQTTQGRKKSKSQAVQKEPKTHSSATQTTQEGTVNKSQATQTEAETCCLPHQTTRVVQKETIKRVLRGTREVHDKTSP